MEEVMEEEFEKFRELNPTLAKQKIMKKDHAFYWNLIRSKNAKVSEVYAHQTRYMNENMPWRRGNFFMILIILQYIEYRFAKPYGVEGDELAAAIKAIKTARRIIGRKADGTNTDVETNTMSELSCVPALILLNGALRHYGLKMIYFHPKKECDELLSLNQRARMSRVIRINIPDARKQLMELKFAKEGRKRIGYTRLQVLDTTHAHGSDVANQYMEWYNDKKFDITPTLTGVLEPELFDTSSIPEIGLKYPHLRPKTKLPLDEASEPEVEDKSPEKESDSEESANEAEEDSNKKPSPHDNESPHVCCSSQRYQRPPFRCSGRC